MAVDLGPDVPDPGHLVDRWLQSLRDGGASERQVRAWVGLLALSAAHGWEGRTARQRAVLAVFEQWLRDQSGV